MAKILIVEDDRTAAEAVKQHLEGTGHTCSVQESGAGVLEVARKLAPDLVVLDVMLPGASGFEVCRRIRSDSELYTLPVVMISAMTGDEEVLHGLAQGADDYVVKPFSLDNLAQRVEALLRTNAVSKEMDALTSLPGSDQTKREIQRRVSRREEFALAYAEVMYIREFGHVFGGEARSKAIVRLGRALQQTGQRLEAGAWFTGHMGGGHFVCILPPSEAKAFCDSVHALWHENLETLYAQLGQTAAYHEARSGKPGSTKVPLVDTLQCLTLFRGEAATAQQLFEILSRIRLKARETRQGGIYVDRRALDIA